MASSRIIIAGGGLAGSLAALALARFRPDVDLLLIEEQPRLGGQHVWSFFDSDIDARVRDFLAPLVMCRWADHAVRFPSRSRHLSIGYNSVSSERLDAVATEVLGASRLILGRAVRTVQAGKVVLDSGETHEAEAVIDARGFQAWPGLALGWQKFLGRTYRFDRPHGLKRPIVMDATVAQADGYRFVYCLPFSDVEMLVEDTYYSDTSSLDADMLRARLSAYVELQGWRAAQIIAEEQGVLPIVLGGKIDSVWSDAPVPLIGLRGGFFHATTGYSLPGAARNALLLADTPDLSHAVLMRSLSLESKRQWRSQRFYRMVNRMLFHAAEPNRRYAVLEHFYRLDPDLIGRFYAGKLRVADKLRILSGRPPVPVGAAIKTALGVKG